MDTSNQHSKTTKDEEVFCISVYLPNEKRSSKDLNTTIQLKNKGQSIKVTSIPWFFIVNFDFGYVFITNYRLKAYVYIGNSFCDILTPFCPKCISLDFWYWTAGWNAHCIGILGSTNNNLTNTSLTPPPEVKK